MEFSTNNKKWGFKVLAIFIYAIVTVVTCVAVWNSCPEATPKVLSCVLLVCNFAAIVSIVKKMLNADIDKE